MKDARVILDKLSAVFDGIEAIEAIAKPLVGATTADKAFEGLHIIATIIDTLKAGFAGKLTAEQVAHEIKNLHQAVLLNDTAADQALHDKFDKETA